MMEDERASVTVILDLPERTGGDDSGTRLDVRISISDPTRHTSSPTTWAK